MKKTTVAQIQIALLPGLIFPCSYVVMLLKYSTLDFDRTHALLRFLEATSVQMLTACLFAYFVTLGAKLERNVTNNAILIFWMIAPLLFVFFLKPFLFLIENLDALQFNAGIFLFIFIRLNIKRTRTL